MKKIHVSLDIKGALLNWELRCFKGMFRPEGGRLMTPREAKDLLLDLLAKGQRYLPYSDCPGFDPEKGCPGHEVTNEQAHHEG